MVSSGSIDINMVEMEWYLMGRDGTDVVEIDFPYFSPSFHYSYSSLPFSPPFYFLVSFSLLLFYFSYFLLFFFFFFFLLFVYCNFLEKKKITFEDFT